MDNLCHITNYCPLVAVPPQTSSLLYPYTICRCVCMHAGRYMHVWEYACNMCMHVYKHRMDACSCTLNMNNMIV